MLQLRSAALLFVAAAGGVTALGPVATLQVANKNIAPDGFPRECVVYRCYQRRGLIQWYRLQCHPC
jgi:hypothetical protein